MTTPTDSHRLRDIHRRRRQQRDQVLAVAVVAGAFLFLWYAVFVPFLENVLR